MNMINYLFIALLFLFLSGCTNTDDDKESNEPSIMFPNYLIINAPSKDPDMPWYVSDFFKRVEQWELETTDYNDHKMGMYELTQHPDQDPANSGQDWDILAVGDATRPDVILTITNQLTGETMFQSPEVGDIAPTAVPQWVAPYDFQLFNHNYEWTLFDNDVSGSELMASGVFNAIELAADGKIVTGDTNAINGVTTLTLYYDLK